MITIVEPKDHIARLWGKQKVRESDTYRLMRYVLRVDHEGKVLLHNVVTGQLVVLSEEEARVLDQLPTAYTTTMEQLVSEHYLVPETFDEHQQVLNLRTILLKLKEAQTPEGIFEYTILTTTACNARCYYCYEQGCKTETMSEKTADEVVQFIADHCGQSRTVSIFWFGGEPTIAADRIDQISKGLQEKGISYKTTMSSNGYLFDSKMVKKAKSLWHLREVQICIDGVKDNYNKVKAFVSPSDDPYERVMRNIGLLLNEGIDVVYRMNYDVDNYPELNGILDEADHRFGDHERLHIGLHPIIGEYRNQDGIISHGTDEWFEEKGVEAARICRDKGWAYGIYRLPYLNTIMCAAYSDNAIVILPDGSLVKCAERLGDEYTVGDLRVGVKRKDLARSWKELMELAKCKDCVFCPYCLKYAMCSVNKYCYREKFYLSEFRRLIPLVYCSYCEDVV